MKFKFTPEVKSIISDIAAMPVSSGKEVNGDVDMILNRINQQLHALDKVPVKGKQWSRIRGEISFLFTLYRIYEEAFPDKAIRYTKLVAVFTDIKSGEALKVPQMVRIGLTYSVIRLSDVEITHLVSNNKV